MAKKVTYQISSVDLLYDEYLVKIVECNLHTRKHIKHSSTQYVTIIKIGKKRYEDKNDYKFSVGDVVLVNKVSSDDIDCLYFVIKEEDIKRN